MSKVCSKITSLFLTFMMLISVISAPVVLATETDNEITGFIWDVNSITGVKFAKAFDDATNIQVLLAVYKDSELVSVFMKDVQTGVKNSEFDSSVTLASGQTAKAFLWNVASVEPLAKSYPITDEGEVDSSCQVVGTSKVILPADNATVRAKLNYALYDSELEENVSAKFTLTGSDLTGLSITEDGVLTTSPQAKAGTVYVNAQYGCKVYQKELTLVKGYYDNFEDDTVDELPNAAGWQNKASYVKQEENGNKYVDGDSAYGQYKFPSGDIASESVTVETDILWLYSNNTLYGDYISFSPATKIETSVNSFYSWFYGKITSDYKNVSFRSSYVPETGASGYKYITDLEVGKWHKFVMTLNYANETMDLLIDGTQYCDDWKFPAIFKDFRLEYIVFNGYTDNVNVYTGSAYDAYEIDGLSTLVAPADNADFTTSINYTLNDVDTKTSANNAVFSLVESPVGFTMAQNGELTVSSDAQSGTITVKATLDGDIYTKEVTVKKGYFTDFENDTTGAVPAGWNTSRNSYVLEEDGNKYIDGVSSYGQIPFPGGDLRSESVTVEFDAIFKNVDNAVKGSTVGFNRGYTDTEFSQGGSYYTTAVDTTLVKDDDTMTIRKSRDENGASISRVAWKDVPFDEWISFKLIMNIENGTYDLYVEDEKLADDWKFNSTLNSFTFTHLIAYGYLDNIRVYSGTRN